MIRLDAGKQEGNALRALPRGAQILKCCVALPAPPLSAGSRLAESPPLCCCTGWGARRGRKDP